MSVHVLESCENFPAVVSEASAMAQPKAQAPFIPGQKGAADLVPEEQEQSSSDGELQGDHNDSIKRTLETSLKGAFATTKDAVQRTKQTLLDILPSSLSSSSAHQARQVVEDIEKDMLANSEGSGEDLSHVTSAAECAPLFMRAKL